MVAASKSTCPYRSWAVPNKLRIAFVLSMTAIIACGSVATAADDSGFKSAGGLTVYVGVVRAEIAKGPPSKPSAPPMHGSVPRGSHEYHVVAAIFDAATKERISDAAVTAKVSGVGLVGSQKTLEQMSIADTTTYGGFFDLPGADFYTISLTIQRAGSQRPVLLDFKYDHRLGTQ